MELSDLTYNILLFFFNPFWDPISEYKGAVYKIKLARVIEKYFIWPFTEFLTGVALLYFFYSVGTKVKDE
jgi:hypothetical protein